MRKVLVVVGIVVAVSAVVTPGYEALATTERIEAAQSPRVEAVSGATSSSRSIMVATYRALTSR